MPTLLPITKSWKIWVGRDIPVPGISKWTYVFITVRIDSGFTSACINTNMEDYSIGFTSPLWGIKGNSGIWKLSLLVSISNETITCTDAYRYKNVGDDPNPIQVMTSSDDIFSYIVSVVGIVK